MRSASFFCCCRWRISSVISLIPGPGPQVPKIFFQNPNTRVGADARTHTRTLVKDQTGADPWQPDPRLKGNLTRGLVQLLDSNVNVATAHFDGLHVQTPFDDQAVTHGKYRDPAHRER